MNTEDKKILIFLVIIGAILLFSFVIPDLPTLASSRTKDDVITELRIKLNEQQTLISYLSMENRYLRQLVYSTKPKMYDLVLKLLDENYKLEVRNRALQKQHEDMIRWLEKNYWEFFPNERQL